MCDTYYVLLEIFSNLGTFTSTSQIVQILPLFYDPYEKKLKKSVQCRDLFNYFTNSVLVLTRALLNHMINYLFIRNSTILIW